MRKPKAKKALAKGKNKVALSATLIAGRANVYREMENSVCDLARAADWRCTFSTSRIISCSPSVNSVSWCGGLRIGITRKNSPTTIKPTTTPDAGGHAFGAQTRFQLATLASPEAVR